MLFLKVISETSILISFNLNFFCRASGAVSRARVSSPDDEQPYRDHGHQSYHQGYSYEGGLGFLGAGQPDHAPHYWDERPVTGGQSLSWPEPGWGSSPVPPGEDPEAATALSLSSVDADSFVGVLVLVDHLPAGLQDGLGLLRQQNYGPVTLLTFTTEG